MKYFKYIILLLFLNGCKSTGPLYYGILKITDIEIEYVDNLYEVSYHIYLGKDADYYTVYYYSGNRLLNSTRTDIKDIGAKYFVGSIEAFAITKPDVVTIVVTSYIGETFQYSDTKTFKINIK